MSCKCDMRTKLVGDGCKHCNPQHYIDVLEDQIKDDSTEFEKLEETIRQQQATIDRLTKMLKSNVAMLESYVDGMNCVAAKAIIAEIEASL